VRRRCQTSAVVYSLDGTSERFVGLTYSALLLRTPRAPLIELLVELRFSGWVGPEQDGWVVAVPDEPMGHVAAHRMRIEDLAEALAARTGDAVACVLVLRDVLLRVWLAVEGRPVIDYVSDASVGADDEPMGLDDFGNPIGAPEGPVGAQQAGALARAMGVPEAADDLHELLAERLGEAESESERLHAVCRLLGWPEWLVSVTSLPRRVPLGPDSGAFTRLRVGRTGVGGRLAARGARVVRRSV